MLMQFGQFVDHDISLSPEDGNILFSLYHLLLPILISVSELPCCDERYSKHTENCAPVIIEDTMQNNDDIFRWVYRGLDSDQKCIPFTRSNPYCYLDYSQNKGAREQFNALTAYLDLSAVYGSERNISEPLREAPSKCSYLIFCISKKGLEHI